METVIKDIGLHRDDDNSILLGLIQKVCAYIGIIKLIDIEGQLILYKNPSVPDLYSVTGTLSI